MKRRRFIGLTIAGLLGMASAHAGRTGRRAGAAPGAMPPVHGLADLFTDTAAARAVGEAYLRAHPGAAHRAQLLAGAGLDPLGPRSLSRAAFERRRQRDFAQGDTLLIEGWLVARAELCACALLACSQRCRRGL